MSFNIEEFRKKVSEMYSNGIESNEKNIQRYFNEIGKNEENQKISNKKIFQKNGSKDEIGSIIEEIEL